MHLCLHHQNNWVRYYRRGYGAAKGAVETSQRFRPIWLRLNALPHGPATPSMYLLQLTTRSEQFDGDPLEAQLTGNLLRTLVRQRTDTVFVRMLP